MEGKYKRIVVGDRVFTDDERTSHKVSYEVDDGGRRHYYVDIMHSGDGTSVSSTCLGTEPPTIVTSDNLSSFPPCFSVRV